MKSSTRSPGLSGTACPRCGFPIKVKPDEYMGADGTTHVQLGCVVCSLEHCSVVSCGTWGYWKDNDATWVQWLPKNR